MDQVRRFVTTPGGVRICTSALGTGEPLVKAPNWLSHVGMDTERPVWRHWRAELSSRRQFWGVSNRDIRGQECRKARLG